MKLPNFIEHPEFNRLREQMGGARLGDFIPDIKFTNTLTKEELEKLGDNGIDISSEDIIFLTDGTIAYKNTRVILYIRDISSYRNNTDLPKFHVSNCKTLQEMKANNRQNRYVVATRDDGLFNVSTMRDNYFTSNNERLNICKNCLIEMNWEEYRNIDKTAKNRIVDNFSVKNFFDIYSKEYDKRMLSDNGLYSDRTAPLNKYTDNWEQISKEIKRQRGNKCEECNIGSVVLHTHHIDGNKFNNHNSNLKVLCEACHKKQPYHSHMR